ncbi:unnamed protein product [Pleuronectes platessa]|uniref:Na(+)/H(+) exchange regulatory cofactor NHE-RF1 n=1 Tax=Pleuronectes platessa TaxID=8262 RepID=A0A9N7Z0Q7_PLEPL|nr:unnamed protein product [Pleuronectes platessa]
MALTLPAIPDWDWTGRGEVVRGQRPAPIVLAGAWSEHGYGPHRNRSLPLQPPPPPPKFSTILLPALLQSHASKTLFLPGEQRLESRGEVCTDLRPRLCVIQRASNGYGFNLHSERARPGQYIRAVDEDSPAERAGVLAKDRIVQVNGMMVEGKTHSQVVAAIKAGGSETRLLLVDADTDAYFKRCRVAPTVDHLTGPLPEPVINGGMEEKVNGRRPNGAERDSKLSISPSPSSASSNTSLTTLPANTPPEGLVSGAIPSSQPESAAGQGARPPETSQQESAPYGLDQEK